MHDYTYLICQLLGERLGGKRAHSVSVFLFLFLTAVFGSSFVLGWTQVCPQNICTSGRWQK